MVKAIIDGVEYVPRARPQALGYEIPDIVKEKFTNTGGRYWEVKNDVPIWISDINYLIASGWTFFYSRGGVFYTLKK